MSDTPQQYLGVMVSSTFRDLHRHRAALMQAIQSQGLHPVAMEQDSALPDGTVVDHSLQKVRAAAAYVGIISHLYGQIPLCESNPERLSLTELEFREARRLKRPILIFIMAPDHPVTVDDVERNPENIEKLKVFRDDVKRASEDTAVHRVYREFSSINELAVAATQSLAELRRFLDTQSRLHAPVKAFRSSEIADIPAPPNLYAEPRYAGSHAFVGRTSQLVALGNWAVPSEPNSVLLFEAIGGAGKSMLTWEWVTKYAPDARGDWSGVLWYSFYEKGAVMADFCRRALAYMTGRPLSKFAKKKQAELSELLLRQLETQPWLLVLDGLERVLVAYHRYDATQLADDQAGRTDEIASRDPRAAIRPEDDELLRRLAVATPSKILITTRLVPRIFLNSANRPIPGVLHEQLPGLRPADAEALIRACGVHGTTEIIQNYLKRHCDCHPLVCGIIAGLVNRYLPARGSFDAWARDPLEGGKLDLAELDLVQKRNHILHVAVNSLSDASRRLLSVMALVPEAIDSDTLFKLNPYEEPATRQGTKLEQGATREDLPEGADSERQNYPIVHVRRQLSESVHDLEQRGLLQYDPQSRRYDLHPVVRGIASGNLSQQERERSGRRVVDHFSSRHNDPYVQADTLDDLRNGLTVVRTLLQMGKTEEAVKAYVGDLARALLLNVEAHAEVLSVLRPLFVQGWESLVVDIPAWRASHLATDVAIALESLGELTQALSANACAVRIDLSIEHWSFLQADISHIASVLNKQNRIARSQRCCDLALRLAIVSGTPSALFIARLRLFDAYVEAGRVDDAEQMWQMLEKMGRNWPRSQYRPGSAELSFARFQLYIGNLNEDTLLAAENIARAGRNRAAIRGIYELRGEWLLERGNWSRAADDFTEAVRMTREAGLHNYGLDARLLLSRLRLGQLAATEQEVDWLSAGAKSAHLPLAEILHAIGNDECAKRHALEAYKYAWADGEPYVRRYDLQRAARLLDVIG